MVTIAVLAILASIAAPSYTNLMERWRVRSASEAMVSTVYLARSEAIRRGGGIVVSKLPNGSGCSLAGANQAWGCGWVVFDDRNNDKVAQDDEVLRTYAGASGTNVEHTNGGSLFTVDRNGVLGSLGAKGFRVYPARSGASPSAARSVCISSGGRITVKEGSSC